jgi:hypothetical protein
VTGTQGWVGLGGRGGWLDSEFGLMVCFGACLAWVVFDIEGIDRVGAGVCILKWVGLLH